MNQKSNGCGPGFFPALLKDLLFNWFFEASCDKHDYGYMIGGNEIRRFECDWKFWLAMKRDTLRFNGLTRFLRWLQAIFFFALVRAFGWTRFNYTN
jgi:hypothetical protein